MKSRRFGNASNPTLLLSALLLALCLPSLRADVVLTESQFQELMTLLNEQETALTDSKTTLTEQATTIAELQNSQTAQQRTIEALQNESMTLSTRIDEQGKYSRTLERRVTAWKLIAATLAALTVVMAIK